MLDVCIFLLLIHPIFCTIPIIENENVNAAACVDDIIRKYYVKGSEITFTDVKSDDDDLIKSINMNFHVSVICRTLVIKVIMPNQGYIIYAKQAKDFLKQFQRLAKEENWNPESRFIILIKSFDGKMLNIFSTLLQYHVINVIVLNVTADPDIYAYNPYENYACGKRFDQIFYYGKCSNPTVDNLFPIKLITGLKNCTIEIASPHWPPYSIDPKLDEEGSMLGIEQSFFKIISDKEQFKTNYRYTNDAEEFTVISEDMSAVGPLALLQENEVDVILGGMMLIKTRADAFDYVPHRAFADELKIVVKRSSYVPKWKTVYLEFQPIVWILLGVAFGIYSLFFIFCLRVKDRSFFVLIMWDSFLLHGYSLRKSSSAVKCAFIMWLWFAYLVNSFYQSSLYSLSTHPVREYQISSEEDLTAFKMTPCISPVIRTFLLTQGNLLENAVTEECTSHMQSMKTVCNREDMFTVVLYNIYMHNKYIFFDKWGRSRLYAFAPLSKVIYAMYFYKGFPMRDRFDNHTMRITEAGLLQKITSDLNHQQAIKNNFHAARMRLSVVMPWFIYLIGVSIATAVFVLEIIVH